MSLIDYGHNAIADQIVRETVEGGRVPTTSDVIALAQECVRLLEYLQEIAVMDPADGHAQQMHAQDAIAHSADTQSGGI